MAKLTSAILWQGASQIDGAPIVLIATGLDGRKSRNSKTGHMVQTWIIRADMAPLEAIRSGSDSTICGDCPHRGQSHDGKGRSCYVNVGQAPTSIYKAFKRGIYPTLDAVEGTGALAGMFVRMGSYGDPAAVPFDVWERLLGMVTGWNGYTHQWRTCDPRFARYCMASADKACDVMAANVMGYRTFRVRTKDGATLPKEVTCPASIEAGQKAQCADCRACGGTTAKARANIVIASHGFVGSNFARNVGL